MDLLILSIGSNPMPNFIVADYLRCCERKKLELEKLPIPDNIMFVYSSETEKFKKTIINQLSLSSGSSKYIGVNLEDKFRDFGCIKEKILIEINKLANESKIDSIHLNYTGGTKPMAVGISSAVEEFNKCTNKIYSDLSPDKFKLILRDGDEFPIAGDIRDIVIISVEDLYELHDLEKPKLKKKNSDWYSDGFIDFLIKTRANFKTGDAACKDFYSLWEQWPGKTKDKDNRKILKKVGDYNKLSKDELTKKLESIKEGLKFSVKDFIDDEKLDSNDSFKKLKKFIRGIWLEEFLFAMLQEIKDDCGLTDIAWNVETKIKDRRFELDVIAMKGCQSFVFTCTTDDSSGLCKSKAFEGLYRSGQIGGEHSKTVLTSKRI